MTKRSEALIRAQRAYETRRPKTKIAGRLTAEEIEKFDRLRGDESRSAVVERLVRDWLKIGAPGQ